MDNLISVIIPAYNVAPCLPRCLDSVLAQTYTFLEIIVINDGSTDKTGEVIERYSKLDSRIISVHKENGGVTQARLEGIKRAKGDYIGFVDGDDCIEADMYERLLRNALKFNAQISHCGYQMCFADGRVHYFHNTGYLVKQDRITALKELLSGSRIEPGLCNKLFHKTLLHSLFHDTEMDTSIKINEDLLMNFYLFSKAETTVFDDWCPYHYIVRENSASRAELSENKIYDPIKVKKIILSMAEEELAAEAKRAYINTCINIYHVLLVAGKEYKKDLKKIRNLLKEEKNIFTWVGVKRALMVMLITETPIVYKIVYCIYAKYFQKKVYS